MKFSKINKRRARRQQIKKKKKEQEEKIIKDVDNTKQKMKFAKEFLRRSNLETPEEFEITTQLLQKYAVLHDPFNIISTFASFTRPAPKLIESTENVVGDDDDDDVVDGQCFRLMVDSGDLNEQDSKECSCTNCIEAMEQWTNEFRQMWGIREPTKLLKS